MRTTTRTITFPPADRHCHVVVVGARIAGATTAMLLARAGLDVVLIDKAAPGQDTLSTHALMRPAIELLDQWGLVAEIVAHGTPEIRRTVFHYGEREAVVDFPTGQELYAPRRTVLDPILVAAAESAGAEVRFGVRMTGLLREASGRVCGVEAAGPTGRVQLHAPLVVGADGARSRMAEAVGADLIHQSRFSSSAIYARFVGVPDRHSYHWYFNHAAGSGVIPTNDDEFVVFAGGPDHEFRRRRQEGVGSAFETFLRRTSPALADQLAGATRVGPFRSHPGRRAHIRKGSGPGWALVGDAGVFTDPMSAHGITAALRDAALAARAALEHLGGQSGEEPSWARFELERDRLARPMMDAIDEVVSYRHDLDTVQRHHLAMNAVMQQELSTVTRFRTDVAKAA